MRTVQTVIIGLLGFQAVSVDSTVTEQAGFTGRIMGGGGRYAEVSRGCSGVTSAEEVGFQEVSASLEYSDDTPFRTGIRAHYFQYTGTESPLDNHRAVGSESGVVINPYLVLNGKYAALGAGAAVVTGPLPGGDSDDSGGATVLPSLYLRLGPESIYFDFSLFHSVPIFTGGYGRLGVGSYRNGWHWWLGIGVGPYDGTGLHGELDIPINDNLGLAFSGRMGSSIEISENAFAAGLTYRFRKGR